MVIIGRTKEILTIEVLPLLEEFLAKRGLALSPRKGDVIRVCLYEDEEQKKKRLK
jgi:hypothetical protein